MLTDISGPSAQVSAQLLQLLVVELLARLVHSSTLLSIKDGREVLRALYALVDKLLQHGNKNDLLRALFNALFAMPPDVQAQGTLCQQRYGDHIVMCLAKLIYPQSTYLDSEVRRPRCKACCAHCAVSGLVYHVPPAGN